MDTENILSKSSLDKWKHIHCSNIPTTAPSCPIRVPSKQFPSGTLSPTYIPLKSLHCIQYNLYQVRFPNNFHCPTHWQKLKFFFKTYFGSCFSQKLGIKLLKYKKIYFVSYWVVQKKFMFKQSQTTVYRCQSMNFLIHVSIPIGK